MPEETVQQRNMRMGWGCKCHGELFCPDLICIDMEDDVPIFVRKDSPQGVLTAARRACKIAVPPEVLAVMKEAASELEYGGATDLASRIGELIARAEA